MSRRPTSADTASTLELSAPPQGLYEQAERPRRSTALSRVRTLARLRWQDWLRIAAYTSISGVLIAVPTRLLPNDWFSRMTPTRPLDYVFWSVASVLFGLAMGLRTEGARRCDQAAVTGGVGTTLAVGCPVCNKLVVAVLGMSGALNVFAPLQPVLGAASIALLLYVVKARLDARLRLGDDAATMPGDPSDQCP